MGFTFKHFKEQACCLCGERGQLTGEHKIKAASLRAEFGNQPLVLIRSGEPNSARNAQSPKSAVFHFSSKICDSCNSGRTQPADREFDRFHLAVQKVVKEGGDPGTVFDLPAYERGSSKYLNVFRYFAKLLCCHMAEAEAPRLRQMSAFARGAISINCVWLRIDRDYSYQNIQRAIGDIDYAAHGGLVVFGNKRQSHVTGFQSARTLGPIRYVFWHRLNKLELLELRLARKKLRAYYRDITDSALSRPMTDDEMKEYGV